MIVDYAAVFHGRSHAHIPNLIMQPQGFHGVLGNILRLDDEARVVHAAPLIPMAGMGNILDKGKAVVDGLFHGPINALDVGIGCRRIHGAEHLRNVHDMTRIKKRDSVLIPFIPILAAKILSAVPGGDFLYDFHFDVNDAFEPLQGYIHKAAFFLKAKDLTKDGRGFSLVKKPKNGGLELLHDIAASHVAAMHVRKQERPVLPAFGLFKKLERRLGDHAQRAFAADKNLIQIRAGGMLWHRQGLEDIAVGQDDLHANALVVNFAIFGGHNADTPMAQRAANGSASQAGGDVLAGIPPLVCIPFQLLKNHPRLRGNGAADLVYFEKAVHAFHVQHKPPRHGQGAPLRTGSASPNVYRKLVIIRNLEYF